jgi:DNA recombination-dependent growth factor C
MGSTDTVDWSSLNKSVTYQLRTPTGWVSVTRTTYATITHPQNRRILLRDEQKIINSELIKV